jgi:DNA-binding GntR family transcriptional regulator
LADLGNPDNQTNRGASMKETTKDRKSALYKHLKTSILTFRVLPGENLDETQLSKTFGLSRTPLREVFRQLAGDGYVDIRANRGARASEMSYTTLRDFFLAAPMIYGAILRLAATNASETQIEALKSAQLECKKSLHTGTSADRALANNRFHEITGAMAGNVYLLPSFNRLLIDHARISMTFYRPQNAQMTENVSLASDQHDQIIAAIEARDESSAAQLANEHWKLSRDQIELFVMPDALEATLGTLPQNAGVGTK